MLVKILAEKNAEVAVAYFERSRNWRVLFRVPQDSFDELVKFVVRHCVG